jgi:hypothetical protein
VHTHVRLSPTTDRPAARKTPKTAKQQNSSDGTSPALSPCRPTSLSHLSLSVLRRCKLPVASCQVVLQRRSRARNEVAKSCDWLAGCVSGQRFPPRSRPPRQSRGEWRVEGR